MIILLNKEFSSKKKKSKKKKKETIDKKIKKITNNIQKSRVIALPSPTFLLPPSPFDIIANSVPKEKKPKKNIKRRKVTKKNNKK